MTMQTPGEANKTLPDLLLTPTYVVALVAIISKSTETETLITAR